MWHRKSTVLLFCLFWIVLIFLWAAVKRVHGMYDCEVHIFNMKAQSRNMVLQWMCQWTECVHISDTKTDHCALQTTVIPWDKREETSKKDRCITMCEDGKKCVMFCSLPALPLCMSSHVGIDSAHAHTCQHKHKSTLHYQKTQKKDAQRQRLHCGTKD